MIKKLGKNLTIQQDEDIQPDKTQSDFMDLKFGLFIHYGINSFYNTETSDGDLPLFSFDPKLVDTDQWCLTARNSGMKYILYTAKAFDGFCSWPSRYSNYTVEHTPYKIDILEKLINSAGKYGLKVGFSYSLWDNHILQARPDERDYHEFVLNQVEELLTNYGKLVEIWFDSFWMRQSSGWKREDGFPVEPERFIRSWRREGSFRWQWDHLYRFVNSIQPECLVFNNSTRIFRGVPLHPVDGRNAEKGDDLEEDQSIWEWCGQKVFLPLQIETTLSVKGKGKFLDGNWYYHQGDHSIAKRWQVKGWIKNAEKINANLLLNVGPGPNGRLRPEDEKLLLKIRE